MTAHSNIPHHPPPRRNSNLSTHSQPPPPPRPIDKVILRPPKLNIPNSGNVNVDVTSEIEGYMTPNDVKLSPVSNGVHYTAPNKQKFNFYLGNDKRRPGSNHSNSSNNSPSNHRRPIHYRKSNVPNTTEQNSEEHNSNNKNKSYPVTSRSGDASEFGNQPNAFTSFGLDNNQFNQARTYPSFESQGTEQDAYNEISEIGGRSNEHKSGSDFLADNDETHNRKNRPMPMVPPKPKPRPPVKPETSKKEDISSNGHPKVPVKPKVFHEDIKSHLENLPVMDGNVGGIPVLPDIKNTKISESAIGQNIRKKQVHTPPSRPPMKPVPRRQRSDHDVIQGSSAFEEENAITI